MSQTLTVQLRFRDQDTAVDKLAFHTDPLFTFHIDLFSDKGLDRLGIRLSRDNKNLVVFLQYGIGRSDFDLLVAITPDTGNNKITMFQQVR